MIQKKICMVGVFGTGKTSLVQRFVYSKFSEKYHSTVGVKIDRKQVEVGGTAVNLLLWDLAGQDKFQSVQASYLRGSAGIFFVIDGTRRETLTSWRAAGAGPRGDRRRPRGRRHQQGRLWRTSGSSATGTSTALLGAGRHVLKTSAKTGAGVNDAFLWLAARR